MKRNHPGNNGDHSRMTEVERLYRNNQERYEDAGGFLEDDDEEAEQRERAREARCKRANERAAAANAVAPDNCEKCAKALIDSFLWERFNLAVCNACRDEEGEHKLIPRTEAKATYMLKDCDFDLRKPPLRYYAKKNPHNPRYGDMKLYLKLQVEKRCLEVYESWEKFEACKEERATQKEIRNERNYEKKIKKMRDEVRGRNSLPKLQFNKFHQHVYGDDEVFDAKKNEFSKICTLCGFKMTYEKL